MLIRGEKPILFNVISDLGTFNFFQDFFANEWRNIPLFQLRGYENIYLWRTEERRDYIKMLSVDSDTKMSRPFSYVKHINFLDLTELGYSNPVYVSFVRHPVDRVISW